MDKYGFGSDKKAEEETELELPDELKVFYCSRTHSQLTQFASELQRVKIPPAVPSEEDPAGGSENGINKLQEDFKHITLGSRKNLCINPKVLKLKSAIAINERCLELQQSKTVSDSKCPYLPIKETEALSIEFRDYALAKIRDIEDLGKLGKKLEICPYYASRPAVKPSEIVTLPYPLLLQKSAREALGLSLKDHVVIIDEAHNLMDAITGIYSVTVTQMQFQKARSQLMMYLQKFRNRLKGKNRVYVAQMVRLLDSIIGFLQTIPDNAKHVEGAIQSIDLLKGKGADQIDLSKLINYLHESKLARKVDGYVAHQVEEEKNNQSMNKPQQDTQDRTIPVLTHIEGFLLALMNPSSEGRFFYTKDEADGVLCLKYMLLDPAYHFKEIVQEARSVILAGGTMSPVSG
jgi:chromosome transmission fidelity protein 1